MAKVLLLKFLIGLLSLLPLSVCRYLGATVGGLMYRFNARMAQVARINIGLCMPGLNDQQRESLVRNCLRETGRTAAEAGITWNWPLQRSALLLEEAESERLFLEAVKAGQGVVMVLMHHGNWEMINPYLYRLGIPFSAIYKRPKDNAIDRWITGSREKSGLSLYPAGREGAQSLKDALRRGGVVLYAPDQEPGPKSGVFAPLFGVEALTGTFTHDLLQSSPGAVAICTWVARTSKGFKVIFREVDSDIYSADTQLSARALNRSIEPCIMQRPEQYQWGYKRFKKRPPEYSRVYP